MIRGLACSNGMRGALAAALMVALAPNALLAQG